MPSTTVAKALAGPSRFEMVSLCALLFCVPLFEAPKHFLWLAWAIAWIVRRGPRALLAPRWSIADWILLTYAASALCAGLFTPSWGRSALESGDGIRMAATAFLLARAGYDFRHWLAALVSATAGALTALAWAVVVLLRTDQPAYLELHSVGHVNHTAIYLAMVLSVALGLAITLWRRRRGLGLLFGLAALAFCVSLFVAASRAALGATVVFLLLVAWVEPIGAFGPRARWRFRLALGGSLLAAAMVYGVAQWASPGPLQPPGEGMMQKFQSRPSDAGILAYRGQLWRVASLAFLTQPVFGIGNDRFKRLSPASFCSESGTASPALESGPLSSFLDALDPCDEASMSFGAHAHSLYASALAERGAFGVLATVALIGMWAALLMRRMPDFLGDSELAGLWCASLGAWCLTALAGVLNTTLHHEHGLLAMVVLGLLLAMCSRIDARKTADS